MIAPAFGADLDGMRALVVGAIDQQSAHASGAHLGEGNLFLAGELRHGPIEARSGEGGESSYRFGLQRSEGTGDRGSHRVLCVGASGRGEVKVAVHAHAVWS